MVVCILACIGCEPVPTVGYEGNAPDQTYTSDLSSKTEGWRIQWQGNVKIEIDNEGTIHIYEASNSVCGYVKVSGKARFTVHSAYDVKAADGAQLVAHGCYTVKVGPDTSLKAYACKLIIVAKGVENIEVHGPTEVREYAAAPTQASTPTQAPTPTKEPNQ